MFNFCIIVRRLSLLQRRNSFDLTILSRFSSTTNKLAKQESRVKLISDLFKISSNEAEQLVETHEQISRVNKVRLKQFVEVVQRTNLKFEDVLKNPAITTHAPGAIEHHYYSLLEMGFTNVTSSDVLRYKEIIKQNIAEVPWNPLESLVRHVDGPPDLKKIIVKKYPHAARNTFEKLHRIVILEYLVWKLKLSHEEILEMVKRYLVIANRSITLLVEVCDLLTKEFGFSSDKIRTNAYLLIISKENTVQLLNEMPILAGIPVRQHVIKFPRVLSLAIDNIKAVENILQEFSITPEQISKCGNVYSFKASTLKERLKETLKIPEFAEMKNLPRFLHIVYYLEKAKRRLEIVKEVGLTQYSVDLFATSDCHFFKRLDVSGSRERRRKILAYLANFFQLSEKTIRHRFETPIYVVSTTSAEDVEKSFSFLVEKGFTRDEILGFLSVVLFDVNSVKEETETVLLTSKTKVDMLKEVLERLVTRYGDRMKMAESSMKPRSSENVLKYGRVVTEEAISLDKYLTRKRKTPQRKKKSETKTPQRKEESEANVQKLPASE